MSDDTTRYSLARLDTDYGVPRCFELSGVIARVVFCIG